MLSRDQSLYCPTKGSTPGNEPNPHRDYHQVVLNTVSGQGSPKGRTGGSQYLGSLWVGRIILADAWDLLAALITWPAWIPSVQTSANYKAGVRFRSRKRKVKDLASN
jgi:hypothetical protein